MKILRYLSLGVVALTALALTHSAQATVVASSGDLILGFRTQDGTNSYNLEVDLGSYSQFNSLAPGTVLNLNLGGFYGANAGLAPADLSTVYGGSWNSLASLAWSVAGSETPTLLATFAEGIIPLRKGTGVQQQPAGVINTVRTTINGSANTYVNGSTTVNLASSSATALSTSLTGSYSGAIRGAPKTIDYAYFQDSTEALVTSSGSSFLNLYQLNTGSGAGTQLGTFALGSNGSFTFTAAPEPTSVLLLGLGGLGFLARRRRV